ncbi:DedA family protein [Candidatus Micrarchaeota archaeon]|nr:DedA family protein [Candidatus Micrarchaeota archaeon]
MVKAFLLHSKVNFFKHVVFGVGVILLVLLALDYIAVEFPQIYTTAEAFIATYGLPGVFLIVFLGSTLLPAPTDASFAIAIKLFPANAVPVVLVAVVASFLAALLNYYLAFFLHKRFIRRFVKEKDVKEAKELFDKYGPIPIVLFGVIPASPVFDPLTLVAGLVRMDVKKFALFSLVSRVLHFVLLAAAVLTFHLF